jgi:hypothetical protein
MVVFSVRIDFYRDLEAPKDYVGSALRDGLSAVVLPRVGEHVLGLGPNAWRKGPYGIVSRRRVQRHAVLSGCLIQSGPPVSFR